MIYFDTDVLIHLLIPQDAAKHQTAKNIFGNAFASGELFMSCLALQEMGYVLNRLGQKREDIEATLLTFLGYRPVGYEAVEVRRAISLCKQVGFQNINDCLHMAIAEKHCKQICTFNKADFARMASFSDLKVSILG
jgi:predicted nucleic acid-binding protein